MERRLLLPRGGVIGDHRRVEEGEVEYVLEPLEPPDEGSVLICVAKPKTNVVVDV